MKVIGTKIIDETEVPMVVECTCLEIGGRSGCWEKFDSNHCRVYMYSAHPSVSYFIIKTDREENCTTNIKPYKWLNLSEATEIITCASESDVIDLRTLGNYQICSEEKIQSVFIINDINEFTEEEEPLLVKVIKEE